MNLAIAFQMDPKDQADAYVLSLCRWLYLYARPYILLCDYKTALYAVTEQRICASDILTLTIYEPEKVIRGDELKSLGNVCPNHFDGRRMKCGDLCKPEDRRDAYELTIGYVRAIADVIGGTNKWYPHDLKTKLSHDPWTKDALLALIKAVADQGGSVKAFWRRATQGSDGNGVVENLRQCVEGYGELMSKTAEGDVGREYDRLALARRGIESACYSDRFDFMGEKKIFRMGLDCNMNNK